MSVPPAPDRGKVRTMPTWLLWLSPVIVAPVLAVFWTSWASRPRGPVQAIETVEQYDRFKAALRQPVPQPRQPAPPTAAQQAESKARAR